ncbi:hypothetical protein ACQ859_06950 [Roseateles chitinivorans]|uniref:hypothetical protein n=1 Tax=Roseateles chitinivorans TaxID=2917965 RepID=UPI003D66FA36
MSIVERGQHVAQHIDIAIFRGRRRHRVERLVERHLPPRRGERQRARHRLQRRPQLDRRHPTPGERRHLIEARGRRFVRKGIEPPLGPPLDDTPRHASQPHVDRPGLHGSLRERSEQDAQGVLGKHRISNAEVVERVHHPAFPIDLRRHRGQPAPARLMPDLGEFTESLRCADHHPGLGSGTDFWLGLGMAGRRADGEPGHQAEGGDRRHVAEI